MDKFKDSLSGLKKKAFEVAEAQKRKLIEESPTKTQHVEDEEKQQEKIEAYSPYFREYRIFIEYKHLPGKVPSGMYVVPSFKSIFVWNGVVFIRQGIYRRGIFKFTINIPESYPDTGPSVVFTTKVFHPQVSEDGDLPLKEIPHWDKDKNWLWHALAYVKKIFYKIDAESPANEEAARLFLEDRKEFTQRVFQCVNDSLANVYNNREDDSIKFSEWREEYEDIRASIVNRKLEGEDKDSLLSWVSSGVSQFGKILSIKY